MATINGTNGNDFLIGGSGDDFLIGGAGNDTLYGGIGSDTADYSAAGAIAVNLQLGVVTNDGDGGFDVLTNIENITGSYGDDYIAGDYSNNYLTGGAGNDTLIGSGGDDTLDGGAGDDTADYSAALSGITVNLQSGIVTNDGNGGFDILAGIEYIIGSYSPDTIYGDSSANVLSGNAGNDRMNGRHGNDTMHGDAGDDILSGWVGDDSINGGTGNDKVLGGSGNDTLIGDEGNDYLNGYNGADILFGGAGADKLKGGAGADIFLFEGLSDSGTTTATRDRIFDFSQAEGDKIDLSELGGGMFIGDAAFSQLGLETEIRYETQTFSNGYERTLVQLDNNADGVADFEIQFSQSLIDFTVDDFLF